jgi:threonine synthase
LDERLPLKKFSDFLPVVGIKPELSLGEGDTPLLRLGCLGRKQRLSYLFAKIESQNPTHSFKDRGTAVSIQKAVALGFKRFGTVSTGNMAASTAAYGARAGLETYVFLKEGTSRMSLMAAGVFNPHLVTVKGDYGCLFYESFSLGKKNNIYFSNSIDPFRIEGYKVTAYEIFLELGNGAPKYVLVPLSSGGHLIGLMRGFEDLKKDGYISSIPTFIGVQAEGCAPLARAYERGESVYTRIDKAETIAHSISNPDPPGGNVILRMIRDHGGIITAVSDQEMLEAQSMLTREEGVFCQLESATTLAALLKLRHGLSLKSTDRVVLVLTGSGLKSVPSLESAGFKSRELSLEELSETRL